MIRKINFPLYNIFILVDLRYVNTIKKILYIFIELFTLFYDLLTFYNL